MSRRVSKVEPTLYARSWLRRLARQQWRKSFITAAAVLDVLSTLTEPIDAVVMAGFGEHGREGARQLLDLPVVDITEAAALLACLLGHKFGVVTTRRSALAPIEQSLLTAGLWSRCAGVRASDLDVLGLEDDLDHTAAALIEQGRILLDQGADVLVLGCADMRGSTSDSSRSWVFPSSTVSPRRSTCVRCSSVSARPRVHGPLRKPIGDQVPPRLAGVKVQSRIDNLIGALSAPPPAGSHLERLWSMLNSTKSMRPSGSRVDPESSVETASLSVQAYATLRGRIILGQYPRDPGFRNRSLPGRADGDGGNRAGARTSAC